MNTRPTRPQIDVEITDPTKIRALAHPVRLAMLHYLDTVKDATATECADHLGESVASCSYHLRELAKHGYIEQSERRGREKPWRAIHRGRTQSIDKDQPGSIHAVLATAQLELDWHHQRISGAIAELPAHPDLAESAMLSSSRWYLTASEAQEVREQLLALHLKFRGRKLPEDAPADAIPVNIFSVFNIEPPTSDNELAAGNAMKHDAETSPSTPNGAAPGGSGE